LPKQGVQEVSCLRIHRVDSTAKEASGEQDLVGVLGELCEVLRPLDNGVAACGGVSFPVVSAPDEIGAKDDTAVVVLEPLGGVDASDLVDPAGIGRPKGSRWSIHRVLALLGGAR